MSDLNTTKDIDLVKIVDEVWKENELHSGTYKVAALTAMQKLQELYETKANGAEQSSEQCNIGNVNVSVSDNIEYYQENNVHENGCSITSGIRSKTER